MMQSWLSMNWAWAALAGVVMVYAFVHPAVGKSIGGKNIGAKALEAGNARDVVSAPADDAKVSSLAAIIAAMPKNIPRVAGPGLEESIVAARLAVNSCTVQGIKVSVLIADTLGNPIVLLSGDGAGVRSQLIAQTKANIVAKFQMPSSVVAENAKADPALAAQVASDPGIGILRGGGLPFYREGVFFGIVAVSGASLANGDLSLDEKCAKIAVDQLEAH